MAVIACKNCGSKVNSEAVACPACGADPRTGEGARTRLRRLLSPRAGSRQEQARVSATCKLPHVAAAKDQSPCGTPPTPPPLTLKSVL
jgi:hypothetical protein